MRIDDDEDFDFNQEFSDEDNEEFDRQREEEERKLNAHPLFIQAGEILQIVDTLIETADEDGGAMYTSGLQESAMIIYTKLAGALNCDSYLICMQKAAIIRDHAEYLRLSDHLLKHSGKFDNKYIKMFREEMEKFRELFKIWAAKIHKMDLDYEDTDWGLFIK